MKKIISILLITLVSFTCFVSCDYEVAASTQAPANTYEAKVTFIGEHGTIGAGTTYYIESGIDDLSHMVNLYTDEACTTSSGHDISLKLWTNPNPQVGQKMYQFYYTCDVMSGNFSTLAYENINILSSTTFSTTSDNAKLYNTGMISIEFSNSEQTYTVGVYNSN